MLAVLLLAGCIFFDGTLSFEYEDFDDESYSYDDEEESESIYSVTDLARVRRFDPEIVSTLNPDEVKGVLNQIMSGRNLDFISDSTSTTNSVTESSKASDYDRFTAITKYGYDNLTRSIRNDDNITPRIRNEYDILTPKFRNEYENVSPGIRNESFTQIFRNEYDNLTPKSRNEYDILTPKSRNEYDILSPKSRNEYDNLTPKSRNEYDILTPKSRNEYDNLTPKSRNEYDNLTPKSRNEYDNLTPKSRNEYDNLTPKSKNEYDNLTPKSRNEYDNLTPKSRNEYDSLTPEFEIEYENSTTSTLGDSFTPKTNLQYDNIGTRTTNKYNNITPMTLKPLLRSQPHREIQDKQISKSKMADASFHKANTEDKKITNIEPEKSFSILRQEPEDQRDYNPDYQGDYRPKRPPESTTRATTPKRTTTTSTPTTTKTKRKRKKKTKTTTVTTTETTTTTTKKTTIRFDVDKFLEVVANLTYDYYTNLTRDVNETLKKMSFPTCGTPTTTPEPTTTMGTGPPDYAGMGHLLIGKCFVCGLDDEGIPYNANCADAFAGDFIPLVPQDPRAKGQIARFRKYCRYQDVNNFIYNYTMPRSIFGRWTGGCAVRWTDLTGVYTQRTCRNRLHATTGRHYASKRMAKLEMALNGIDDGCIISPVATLLPLSRGISLFARFHACVCTGNWCNKSPQLDSDVWMTYVIALTAVLAPWSND